MLGPVLEAVTSWILDSPADREDDDYFILNPDVNGGEEEFSSGVEQRGLGASLQDGLAQVFGKLGLGGGWGVSSAAATSNSGSSSRGVSGGAVDITDAANVNNAPIDLCNGVILHLFLDSPQVAPPITQSQALFNLFKLGSNVGFKSWGTRERGRSSRCGVSQGCTRDCRCSPALGCGVDTASGAVVRRQVFDR